MACKTRSSPPRLMHKDEKALLKDFKEMFAQRPDLTLTKCSSAPVPYLPQSGALGAWYPTGGTIAYYRRGVDGVVDISPFTCMNGIVTEAIYPRISKDHDHIPAGLLF